MVYSALFRDGSGDKQFLNDLDAADDGAAVKAAKAEAPDTWILDTVWRVEDGEERVVWESSEPNLTLIPAGETELDGVIAHARTTLAALEEADAAGQVLDGPVSE